MRLDMRVEIGNYAFDAWIFAAPILLLLIIGVWFRTRNWGYVFCFTVFGIYLLYALDKVFFPLPISGSYADSMRTSNAQFIDNLNLIPFHFGRWGTFESTAETLFLNVLLTIPFGFGINFLLHIRAKHFLWIAPALGISIETVQLGISFLLGFIYRVIDVNDVLMNMLGVWIGYGIFRIFVWLYLFVRRFFGSQIQEIAAYFHEVVRRTEE